MPQLAIEVLPDQISFDYRMGSDWGAPQLLAFFAFLADVVRLAPNAIVTHQFEGAEKVTPIFTEVWQDYMERK